MTELKSKQIGCVKDYVRMLNEGYEFNAGSDQISRLEYLSDYIFDFTTYDSAMAELFATKALEVCQAISDRTTFDYIKEPDSYRWYLVMVNMPFFSGRLNWGTSIRGAWWDVSAPNSITFSTCGLWSNGVQITELAFTTEKWNDFVVALLDFGADTKDGA